MLGHIRSRNFKGKWSARTPIVNYCRIASRQSVALVTQKHAYLYFTKIFQQDILNPTYPRISHTFHAPIAFGCSRNYKEVINFRCRRRLKNSTSRYKIDRSNIIPAASHSQIKTHTSISNQEQLSSCAKVTAPRSFLPSN